jgi:hypothetical protein
MPSVRPRDLTRFYLFFLLISPPQKNLVRQGVYAFINSSIVGLLYPLYILFAISLKLYIHVTYDDRLSDVILKRLHFGHDTLHVFAIQKIGVCNIFEVVANGKSQTGACSVFLC